MSLLRRHVVTVALTSIADVDAAALNRRIDASPDDERARAERFRDDAARTRFVLGRALLRFVIARSCDIEVEKVRIGVEPSGRPFVAEPPSSSFVSLAHSGRYVAAAIAERRVGIDIEEYRATSPALAERVCSPDELRRLDALSDAERERAFMAIWTRKEAYGKALGVGIGFELRSVTAGPPLRRVRGVDGRWSVCDLDVAPGYAAALVVAGGRPRVQVEHLDTTTLLS